LGFRLVRKPHAEAKPCVYTFVSDEALTSIKRKVKALTKSDKTNLSLTELIWALNPVLRGWAAYFPTRRFEADVLLPPLLHMVASGALAVQEAPAHELERAVPPVSAVRSALSAGDDIELLGRLQERLVG
jgi:hypothetical protein